MGNIIRSSSSGSEDQNSEFASLQYNYPPKNGHNYFANTYIMGNERFETSMPECYLFGENLDLNFLAKPTAFPYLPPQPHEPTRTLRSLINIRRESLRFVKCKEDPSGEEFVESKPSDEEVRKKETAVDGNQKKEDQHKGKQQPKGDAQLHQQSTKADAIISFSNYNPNTNYNVEFVFDSDVKLAISIYYFCFEEVKPSSVSYSSKNLYINSPTYFYESGANQLFCQPHHVFNPSLYDESELVFKPLDEEGNFVVNNSFPFVIQCVSLEGEDPKQSHSLIATIERNNSDGGGYALKPFKQKIFIDGLCYLMQEIYGIEKKNPNPVTAVGYNHFNLANSIASGNLTGPLNQPLAPPPPLDDELEDGSECVICMVESRDCLILPCRHLCLCSLCADSLRFQASSCPICRSPFMALLHIKTVRKLSESNQKPNSTLNLLTNSHSPLPMVVGNSTGNQSNGEQPPATDEVPAGYEAVSLIDALNNSCSVNNERSYTGEDGLEFRRINGSLSGSARLRKSDGALNGQSSCPSLYESTHEEEEEEEDSIGGAENIELASGSVVLNLQQSSKSSSIGQETTKLLFNEQERPEHQSELS